MYLIRKSPLARPWQGDIYKDVNLIQAVTFTIKSKGKREYNITETKYDYTVILTQECDLEQDYKNRVEPREDQDSYIQMILMAPAYLAESLRNGVHLEQYGQVMQHINTKDWNKVKKQENKRYHYIQADAEMNVPELAIDFKHFYTLSRDYFYNNIMNDSYFISMTILHREVLSQRFCNFLARIGIPDDRNETKLLTDSLCARLH
jgi:hypothetical protein